MLALNQICLYSAQILYKLESAFLFAVWDLSQGGNDGGQALAWVANLTSYNRQISILKDS
jgi:hypothetical protein